MDLGLDQVEYGEVDSPNPSTIFRSHKEFFKVWRKSQGLSGDATHLQDKLKCGFSKIDDTCRKGLGTSPEASTQGGYNWSLKGAFTRLVQVCIISPKGVFGGFEP